MIPVIILCIHAWLIGLLHSFMRKSIMKCNSVDEAIVVRKRYKLLRNIGIVPYFLLNLLVLIIFKLVFDTFITENSNFIFKIIFYHFGNMTIETVVQDAAVWTIMGYTIGTGFNSFNEFNPVHFLTIKDFYHTKAKESFALYLRGFNTDKYDAKFAVEKKDCFFSEKLFAKQISRIIPIYAVGMPKELTAPCGSKRIYLDDSSWKEDVLNLMKRSHSIFILVNHKESCIWEIEQSTAMLEKTCYIVDNIEEYNTAREKIAHIIELPEVEPLGIEPPFFIRMAFKEYNGKQSWVPYINSIQNTEKDYKRITRAFYGKKLSIPIQHKNDYILYINCNKENKKQSFERKLIEELREFIPVYTKDKIGKKELVCDEDCIHNELSLPKRIEKSPHIAISIVDTDFGLEALKYCITQRNKTIFIVENYYSYLYIKLKHNNIFKLPQIDNRDFTPFIFYYSDNNLIVEKYSNHSLTQAIFYNKICSKRSPWFDITVKDN